MTFRQLFYLVEVSKYNSINKAAQKLYISQSTISNSIRELEDYLGIQLLHRTNRGIEFTEQGNEFLHYAKTLLLQKQHLEGIYRKNHPRTASSSLSVASQRYTFVSNAFAAVVRLLGNAPYNLSIKEEGIFEVLSDVASRIVDIGVIYISHMSEKTIEYTLKTNQMDFFELGCVKPCVFLRKGHPLPEKKRITTESLRAYPYLRFGPNEGTSLDFSEDFMLASLDTPLRVIDVTDHATAIALITATDAFTPGNGLLTEGTIDSGMVSVPLEGSDHMRIGWVKLKNKAMSEEMRAFVQSLGQYVNESISFTTNIWSNRVKESR